MIDNPNKVLARISYTHVPPRCRKARGDSIHVFGDTEQEARELAYKEALDISMTSKQVVFAKKMTLQPAEKDEFSTSYAIFPIAGMDGCVEESFEIGGA